MLIIGDTSIEYPNFDFGYETTITLPFRYSRLSNGQITVIDEGEEYDMYSCKGSMVIKPELLRYMGAFNHPLGRGGQYALRDVNAGGFYPFTPAAIGTITTSPAGPTPEIDTFFVAFNKIDLKGKVDIFARAFRVDVEMFGVERVNPGVIGSELIFVGDGPIRPEGEITISGNGASVTGIRHPINGFNPSKGYSAYPRQMLGGGLSSVNYYFMQDYEPRASVVTITATTQAAAAIIRALVRGIRARRFRIQAPTAYSVFGGVGEDGFYAKLSSGNIRVKHTRFDEFEITLNLEMEINRG